MAYVLLTRSAGFAVGSEMQSPKEPAASTFTLCPNTLRPQPFGTGYLAGTFPDGNTTLEGAPVSARVRAYWENPKDGVLYPVGDSTSDASGVWKLEGLSGERQYLVRGSLSGHRDVLAQDVYPKDVPRFSDTSKQVFVGVALNYKLPVIGGKGAKTLALASGVLPSGVTLTGSTLSGSWPTGATGEYPMEFSITDDVGTYSAAFSVMLVLLPLSLQGGSGDPTLNTPFSCAFVASGGEGPYVYSVSAGALPAGLSLDSSTGLLSGTPGASGDYSYAITVTDVRSQTSSRAVSGTVRVPHKYWRINITASNTHASVTEIEMSDRVGGPDLCVGGTIVSSGTYPASDCNMAYAFDDITSGTNCWASNVSTSGWIGYCFAAPVAIAVVRIWKRIEYEQSPKDFSIQYSDDGINYTTVKSYTGITSWPNGFVEFSGW